jgi:hypothetical protein
MNYFLYENNYYKNVHDQIKYGAGFRAVAEALDMICFRTGIFLGLY